MKDAPLKKRKIGIIGGTSWESTVLVYSMINREIRERLGGLNSAEIVIQSLNYDPIVKLENEGKWDEVGGKIAAAAKALQDGGAEFVLLACNTLHKVTLDIEKAIHVPFLHIADASGQILAKNGVKKVGLLGTQFTMEDGFYAERLKERFGLEVIVPDEDQRKRLNEIIYGELCLGKVLKPSKAEAIGMIETLQKKGAQAILLGCTELGMLIQPNDANIGIYDTTELQAKKAVQMHLGISSN